MRSLWCCLSLLMSTAVFAQDVEITPFGGFNFGGTLPVRRGDVKLRNNGEYGLMASYRLNRIAHIELSYTGFSSTLVLEPAGPEPNETLSDIYTSYFLLGATKELLRDGPFRPFGNFSLGAAWFSMRDNTYDDDLRFAASLGLGAKYFFSDRMGIRVQARLLAPLYGAGVGVACGTGGCGASVGSGSLFVSGDVLGGLIFAF